MWCCTPVTFLIFALTFFIEPNGVCDVVDGGRGGGVGREGGGDRSGDHYTSTP